MRDAGIPITDRLTQRFALIVLYFILTVAAILSLIPFWWMLISSLKPLNDILTIPVWIIPTHPTLENFQLLLTQTFFLRSVINSLAVCLANVLIQVFLCSLAGFAFAKYRFRGRNLLF